MNNELKPYDEYKDTDLLWLDTVPSHWNMIRNKNVLKLRKVTVGQNHGKYLLLSLTKQGIIARDMENAKGKFPKEFDTYQIVNQGNMVFCLFDIDETPRTVGLSSMEGMITGAYTVFKVENINEKYLYYYYLSIDNNKKLKPLYTGLRKVINTDTFLRTKMPIPPRDEQDQIVKYLDHQLAKINKFIKAKKKLIATLKEQKQAVINEAVTKGINPNVKMKLSGIEWLGDIPEHWEVRRIKTTAKILRGKFNHRPRNDERLYNGKYPFIQTGDVARANKYIISYKQTLNERGYDVSKEFPKGTLTMTIAANIGDVSILDFNACFPDSIVGFIPRKEIDLEYLYYTFTAMKQEFLKEAPVNTQGNLNIERVGAMCIAIPHLEEQKTIVIWIESKTEKIDNSIKGIQQEIELITEYRTSLISDVATGKVDVQNIKIDEILNEEIEIEAADDEIIEGEEDIEIEESGE